MSSVIEVTHDEAARFALFKATTCKGRKITTTTKLKMLHEVHTLHPHYTRSDLRMVTGCSTEMVRKYWKTYVKYSVNVIRDFDEELL